MPLPSSRIRAPILAKQLEAASIERLDGLELEQCRVDGCALPKASGERVLDCQLDYATFPATRFHQVSFERCRLKEADFSGADLCGTFFTACDLDGVDLTRAELRGTDISASTFRSIRAQASDVRGLVVNREQATAMSQLFGLVIRDE